VDSCVLECRKRQRVGPLQRVVSPLWGTCSLLCSGSGNTTDSVHYRYEVRLVDAGEAEHLLGAFRQPADMGLSVVARVDSVGQK
jgi:hypothetical protein